MINIFAVLVECAKEVILILTLARNVNNASVCVCGVENSIDETKRNLNQSTKICNKIDLCRLSPIYKAN